MTPAHGRAAGTRMGVRQPPLRGMAPGETHAYTVFFEKFFGGGNRGPPMHPSISKVAAKKFPRWASGRAIRRLAMPCKGSWRTSCRNGARPPASRPPYLGPFFNFSLYE